MGSEEATERENRYGRRGRQKLSYPLLFLSWEDSPWVVRRKGAVARGCVGEWLSGCVGRWQVGRWRGRLACLLPLASSLGMERSCLLGLRCVVYGVLARGCHVLWCRQVGVGYLCVLRVCRQWVTYWASSVGKTQGREAPRQGGLRERGTGWVRR